MAIKKGFNVAEKGLAGWSFSGWYFWNKTWRQEMEFLFPDVFIPRLDVQTDQNVSIRPKSAALWPGEMNPAQHPL